MRRHWGWSVLVSALPSVVLFVACSDSGGGDLFPDAGPIILHEDARPTDHSVSDTLTEDRFVADTYAPDASDATDASDASDVDDASDAYDAPDTYDAGPQVEKLCQGSGYPVGIAVSDSTVYFTEYGATGVIRSCPKTGGGGTAATLQSPSSGHAIWSVAFSSNFVFDTDDQYTQGLYRMGPTGASWQQWASASNNAGPIAANDSVVIWADQTYTYKSSPSTAGSSVVMNVGAGWSGFSPGPPIQSVAVDATNVYASNGAAVYRCGLTEVCGSDAGVASSTSLPNILGMFSDGTRLYMTGGVINYAADGHEYLWSVPVAGGSATMEADITLSANGNGSHLSVVVDATNVYWGSIDGSIYVCAKASCSSTKKPLASNARPYGITQDANYIYWVDRQSGGVYRIRKY